MTKEPAWVQAGYGVNSYQAECRICGTVAELEFAEGTRELLSPEYFDEVNQLELFAYVFFWTLEKLRRECECSPEERKAYTPPQPWGKSLPETLSTQSA